MYTEEDNRAVSEELKQQLAPVGKITLAFWYVEETRAVRPEELPQQRLEEFGTVSEKALKKWCLTHHAGYVSSLLAFFRWRVR